MKALWPLGFFLAAFSGAAATNPAWQFVLVERSSDLNTRSGTGELVIHKGKISGTLTSQGGVPYSLSGSVKDGRVSVVFGAIESDSGGTKMIGTFRQSTMPSVGGSECWQTIQLSDGFSSVSLARNVPSCEP
jgi:hypothetical protein